MFTGIVEEMGVVKGIKRNSKSASLTIAGAIILEDAKIGDSISVNGVCLTVVTRGKNEFTADVMHETMKRSSLGALAVGSNVNLERAMPSNGRFGGHIVSGHIDGTGTISKIKKDDNAYWYTIAASNEILRYIVEKGSVAIDGISLTVAAVTRNDFSVSVIPHTMGETILKKKKTGVIVNIENDVVGKYIELFMSRNVGAGNITKEFLLRNGF